MSRVEKILKKGMALIFAAAMLTSMSAFSAAAANDRKYNFPEGAADVAVSLDGAEVLVGESAIIISFLITM